MGQHARIAPAISTIASWEAGLIAARFTKPWISRETAQIDRRRRRPQRLGVGLALVAQRVEAGRDDERGRQPGEVSARSGRRAGRRGRRLARGSALEPVHVAFGQEEAVGEELAWTRRATESVTG